MIGVVALAACISPENAASKQAAAELAADPLAQAQPPRAQLIQSDDQVGERPGVLRSKPRPTSILRVYRVDESQQAVESLGKAAQAAGWSTSGVGDGSIRATKDLDFGGAVAVVAALDEARVAVTLTPADPDL